MKIMQINRCKPQKKYTVEKNSIIVSCIGSNKQFFELEKYLGKFILLRLLKLIELGLPAELEVFY